MTISQTVTAGDSIALSEPDAAAAYPSSSGWTITVVWMPERGGVAAVQTALDAAGVATVLPATTAAWSAGLWRWALVAARTGERVTLGTGQITVRPDPLAARAVDLRSQAKRILDAVDATIEGRASSSDLKVTLADGRSIERLSHSELIAMRDRYARMVSAEERKASGRGPARVLVEL